MVSSEKVTRTSRLLGTVLLPKDMLEVLCLRLLVGWLVATTTEVAPAVEEAVDMIEGGDVGKDETRVLKTIMGEGTGEAVGETWHARDEEISICFLSFGGGVNCSVALEAAAYPDSTLGVDTATAAAAAIREASAEDSIVGVVGELLSASTFEMLSI